MEKASELARFAIFHFPFSMQDAFFSILLASPRPVDGMSKAFVVRRAFDDVVVQRARIADQRGELSPGTEQLALVASL